MLKLIKGIFVFVFGSIVFVISLFYATFRVAFTKKNTRPKFKVNIGGIYYQRDMHRFFQVRGIHDDYVTIGFFTMYYDSALFKKFTQKITHDKFKNSDLVERKDLAQYALFDGKGWRAR